MGKHLSTPLIKPRKQGGTFYTFGSAIEDVGLNINESTNKVRLSKYILLNLPDAFYSGFTYQSSQSLSADDKFAMGFENYTLNMETVFRNADTYDFSKLYNISERCFWKTLKKYGWVNFTQAGTGSYYYDSSSCVVAMGDIVAGAQRDDEYGIYNETFVQIPSSYGKAKVLFTPYEDKNMYSGITKTSSSSDKRLEYLDASLYTGKYINVNGYDSSGFFDNGSNYAVSQKTDTMNAVFFDKDIYQDNTGTTATTIDEYMKDVANGDYEFNAVLVYYTIYDGDTGSELATNAYGLLVFNNAVNDKYPTLKKEQATDEKSGTSYSFRVNIKTSSVYGGGTTIQDNSTPAYSMSEDFNDMIKNLSSIVSTLKTNSATLSSIASDYTSVKNIAVSAKSKTEDLEQTINAISNLYTKEPDSTETLSEISTTSVNTILSNVSVNTDENDEVRLTLDIDSISDETTKGIAKKMIKTTSSGTYVNTASLLALCIKKLNQ